MLRSSKCTKIKKTPLSLKVIGFSFIALPLWWLLGIEQFVWPLVGMIAIAVHGRISFAKEVKYLTLFVLLQLLSALFITESYRYLTFARAWTANVGALFFFALLISAIRSIQDVRFLVRSITISMIFAGIAGLLAIGGVWRDPIMSLLGSVLPESIGETTYGQRLVYRTLGASGYFIFLGNYFRISSFWLYATTYATTIVAIFPLVIWAIRYDQRMYKWLHIIAALFLLVNLIFTTGRSAILGFTLGLLFFLLRRNISKAGLAKAIALVVSVFLLVVGSVAILTLQDTPEYGSLEWADNADNKVVSLLLMARGKGSFIDRIKIYHSTITDFWRRPILGWGTERDISGLPYPAGSHSYYLGVLYRYGLVGFLALLIVVWSCWKGLSWLRVPVYDPNFAWAFSLRRYVQWSLVAVLINGFTDAWDLDSITFVLIWVVLGVGIAAGYVIRRVTDGESQTFRC